MFGRKKEAPPVPKKTPGKGNALMAQLGMMDVDDVGGFVGMGDDDDDDDDEASLEAELRALEEEDKPKNRGKEPDRKKLKGKMSSHADIDRMRKLAEIKDDESDEDMSDTEAPDLLAELEGLSMDESDPEESPVKHKKGFAPPLVAAAKPVAPPPVAAAKPTYGGGALSYPESNSRAQSLVSNVPVQSPPWMQPTSTTSPGPMFPSVLSVPVSLQHQQQQHQPTQSPYGVVTPPTMNVIPRAVVEPYRPAPAAPAKSGSTSASAVVSVPPALNAEDADKYRMLSSRRDQYKMAAMSAKKAGDNVTALNYIKVSKQFEGVLQALEEGKPIDLSQMPPPPPSTPSSVLSGSRSEPSSAYSERVTERMQGSGVVKSNTAVPPPPSEPEETIPELTQEDKKKLFNAPEKASTVLEALQQRLAKYKEAEAQAKEENNTSKVKRQARIVKQYEDAIKLHRAGKPVDFEELPSPPGFPPIPTGGAASHAPAPAVANQQAQSSVSTPTHAHAPPPSSAVTSPAASNQPKVVSPPKPGLQKQVSVSHSRADQQASFLEERQAQFKAAAIQAKAAGDIELAKKYLRMTKGFDQMIEASKSGLPVDLSQVPAPPGTGSEADFEFVSPSDCGEHATGDRGEVYKKLQEELANQIRTSESNRDHFTKLGDVSSATKFDKLFQNSRKDLDALKNAYEHADPVPRFHYESCSFSIVQSCTELGDNDLEIIIIRGLNYNLPQGLAVTDLNTYVKYEFPFPETLQVGDTAVIKSTNCPEYNQTFKLQIERKSRSFLRLLKSSKVIKCEVFYKRGFMKGDKSLGTVNIKLLPLETKCVYHDSYDLMEGRKAVGGKLEVKVRVREPFVTKQVEEVKEKWLIIDQFERKVPPQPVPRKETKPKPASAASTNPAVSRSAPGPAHHSASSGSSHFSASMSVLQFEKQQIDGQIQKYANKLKPAEIESLRQRGAQYEQQANAIRDQLQKGGAMTYKSYIDAMTQLQAGYTQEAQLLAANQSSKEKIQIVLTKRKLVEKEIETLRQKLRTT